MTALALVLGAGAVLFSNWEWCGLALYRLELARREMGAVPVWNAETPSGSPGQPWLAKNLAAC